jgi:phosphoribosylformimino-5-aminoimidazole carboxamide ribotide isomerase
LKPLRIVGVIDILRARAVHARGGRRAEYLPVATAAGVEIAGDPVALARVYVERLGLEDVYVADLDAIEGRPSQDAVLASIARTGADVWVDAGIASVAQAHRALRSGARRIIIGLETLHSFDHLRDICSVIGGEHVAFSLDLRGGVPVIAPSAAIPPQTPEALAASAAEAGVGALIVLDLQRVGTVAGLDMTLLGIVRRAAPHVPLFAGGGVRGWDDLARLADGDCDGALVATALHSGAIDPRARSG